MKKLILFIVIGMFFSSCMGHDELRYTHYKGDGKTKRLLKSIESGRADADAFVYAIKSGSLQLKDVSPDALANYLEAFANEGILYWTPPDYFENEEMLTSLEVVFEFRENRMMNRRVYEQFSNM